MGLAGLDLASGRRAPWKQPTKRGGTRVSPEAAVTGNWKLTDAVWRGVIGTLRLTIPGEAYSVLAFWHDVGALDIWYINLEEPLALTLLGFDFLDRFLDVKVNSDLSGFYWKDEAELTLGRATRPGVE